MITFLFALFHLKIHCHRGTENTEKININSHSQVPAWECLMPFSFSFQARRPDGCVPEASGTCMFHYSLFIIESTIKSQICGIRNRWNGYCLVVFLATHNLSCGLLVPIYREKTLTVSTVYEIHKKFWNILPIIPFYSKLIIHYFVIHYSFTIENACLPLAWIVLRSPFFISLQISIKIFMRT